MTALRSTDFSRQRLKYQAQPTKVGTAERRLLTVCEAASGL